MAENHGIRLSDESDESRFSSRVDHHEEFGEIASGDFTGNARLATPFEAERSVAATGVDFDHQQFSVHDSAFASGAARFVEEGGIHADVSVYDGGQLTERTQAEQARAFDFEQGSPAGPDGMGIAGASLVADATAPRRQRAFDGVRESASVAYARPSRKANQRTRERWAESQEEKKQEAKAAYDAAHPDGLAGGATYVDAWKGDEAARAQASVADFYDATGDASVVESAGEVFFVDREHDYANDIAEEGDGTFDVDKAYAKGKEAKFSNNGSFADKAKARVKSLAKAGALAVVEEGSGDVAGESDEDAVGALPNKAKAAKNAYSRLHRANAQKGLSSAQRAARHGVGKNAAVESARTKVAEGAKGVRSVADAVKARIAGMGNALKNPAGLKVAVMGGAVGFLFVLMMIGLGMCTAVGSGASGGSSAEAIASWAESVAANDKVGYSQPNRTTFETRADRDGWGDVDCSSFVYYALLNNGWTKEEIGSSPFATFGMCDILEKCDFTRLDWDDAKDSLQRGDIVVDVDTHVSIYAGDGREIAAHHDENGGIAGPQMGDQHGDEVSVGTFYAPGGGFYPDYVMRCTRTGGYGDFSGNTNIEKCWNFFTSRGYSKEAAAGIIGNLMQESTPSVLPDYHQVGGPGYGIAQWGYNDGRRQNLERMAAQWGYEPSSIEAQLLFIDWEMNGGDSTTLALLNSRCGGIAGFKSLSDVSSATQLFCTCFERAGNAMMANRISFALSVYGQYS